jgi:hypothetical protein
MAALEVLLQRLGHHLPVLKLHRIELLLLLANEHWFDRRGIAIVLFVNTGVEASQVVKLLLILLSHQCVVARNR